MRRLGWLIAAGVIAATPLAAQQAGSTPAPLRLSLAAALARVDSASEAIGIARAGVAGAGGRTRQAASGWWPQLSGSASYTRTLQSQFSSLQDDDSEPTVGPPVVAPVDCGRYRPNPSLPIGERLDSLERGLDCTANGGGGLDFASLPFGQANAWRFGIDLRQNVFDRSLTARIRGAHAGEEQADAALAAAEAGALLDAATAYLDAQLADRLLAIAESTLVQSERTYADIALAGEVGTAAEFDVLRAAVARDNQRPVVADRRATRDIAMLRLRQVLDIDAATPLELTTGLDDTTTVMVPGAPDRGDAVVDADRRAPVREAVAAAQVARAARDAAVAGRWPTVSVVSSYAQLAYPRDVFRFGTFLSDWTVGVQVAVPLFTGGRLGGAIREATAAADAARLRAQQVREGAVRDAAEVTERLTAAAARYAASEATVLQARRAQSIAELRVREGLSTLTDLAEVRLQRQQAEANQAQAARDLQVARLRRTLLPDLPIGTGAAGGTF
jgi:outer membrane protein TolC